MGKAIFDILLENGADWIEVPGDFTKRITSDMLQVYLSVSPEGDKLACYFETSHGNYFKIHEIPEDLGIRNLTDDFKSKIVEKLIGQYPWVSEDCTFEIKKNYYSMLVAISPSARWIVVYGLVSGDETILLLDNM